MPSSGKIMSAIFSAWPRLTRSSVWAKLNAGSPTPMRGTQAAIRTNSWRYGEKKLIRGLGGRRADFSFRGLPLGRGGNCFLMPKTHDLAAVFECFRNELSPAINDELDTAVFDPIG